MKYCTLPQGFAALPAELSNPESAKALVLPVPYDMTASYMAGARRGPAAIIDASRHMELFDDDAHVDFSLVGIATLDEVCANSRGPEHMLEALYEAARDAQKNDQFLLTLGGEHSITSALVRATQEKYSDLGVLQFDAHLDLRDSYEESPYNHACVMRRIHADLGLPITQVGIRSFSEEEHLYVKRQGLRPFCARELMTADPAQRSKLIEHIVAGLPKHVYLTFDLDALDPSVLPATGTPEPGGLDWYLAVDILRQVARHTQIVAADIVELSPLPGHHASDFLAAKLAYKVIGYALGADAR